MSKVEPKVAAATVGAGTGALLGIVIAWGAAQAGVSMDENVANALGTLLVAGLSAVGSFVAGFRRVSSTSEVSVGYGVRKPEPDDRGAVGLGQVVYVLLIVLLVLVVIGVLGRVL